MGGKGSGRLNITNKLLKDATVKKTTPVSNDVVGGDFVIPNHSGDNSAGTVLTTPVNNTDIPNKKYVDDAVGVAGLWEVDGTETQLITADEIDMQTRKIINLVDPTQDQDAASKKYVDDNATSVGGSNTQLQYNNSGSFGGIAELTYVSGQIVLTTTGDDNSSMIITDPLSNKLYLGDGNAENPTGEVLGMFVDGSISTNSTAIGCKDETYSVFLANKEGIDANTTVCGGIVESSVGEYVSFLDSDATVNLHVKTTNTAVKFDDGTHTIYFADVGASSGESVGAYMSRGGDTVQMLDGTNGLKTNAHIRIQADSEKLFLGTGDDASVYYDNTNMIINPKEVGSGVVNVKCVDPEIRLEDTGNSEYTRVTKSDTTNKAIRYNRLVRTDTGLSVSTTGSPVETTDGIYTVLTYSSNGTFVVDSGSADVEVLVVGGGGGGGSYGGGGGAGGYQSNAAFAVTAQSYTVTVGSGGAANTGGGNSVFGSITANGGGEGGSNEEGGAAGGCGGGGGLSGNLKTGGAGSQGGNGGNNSTAPGDDGAGGGGGATGNGQNGSSSKGGNGGAGTSNSITGSAVTYAGGGGGGAMGGSDEGGTGGAGGGGNGGSQGGSQSATVGTDGLGGGGGGTWGTGQAGGDGIVIVRYIKAATATVEAEVWQSQDGTNSREEGIITFGYDGSLATRGSRTVLDGQTLRFNINGTEYAQMDNSGDFNINTDGGKITLGAANDAGIWYDGTNIHIDAALVGSGTIILDNIPTSDPSVAGGVWSNSGVLTLSSG